MHRIVQMEPRLATELSACSCGTQVATVMEHGSMAAAGLIRHGRSEHIAWLLPFAARQSEATQTLKLPLMLTWSTAWSLPPSAAYATGIVLY